MDEITFSDFAAAGYNYIPVIRKQTWHDSLGALLRCFPESSVWKLAFKHRTYVYLTLDYQHKISAFGNTIVAQQGQTVHTWPDTPLWPYIEDLRAAYTVPPLHSIYADLPPLMGGMIGILPRAPSQNSTTSWPDATWLVMKTVIILDTHEKTLWLLAYDDPIHRHTWITLNQQLDVITKRLADVPEETALMRAHAQQAKIALAHQTTPEALMTLAQAQTQALDACYAAMRYVSTNTVHSALMPEPADFLAYVDSHTIAYWLHSPTFQLLGAADTCHITLSGQTLCGYLASPVPSPDETLASLLWDSLRNDLSQVALPGSMRIVDPAIADGKHHWQQQYLQTQIAEDTSVFDVLRACHPASAFLGCPKIDAPFKLNNTSSEPYLLGCQIAIIGWDHQSVMWVSQKAKHWHSTSDIHVSSGETCEEIGIPVIAGLTPKLAKDKA